MINALPFRLVSQLDQKKFAENLEGVLAKWANTWFQNAPRIQLHSLDSEKIATFAKDKWIIFGKAPDSWIGWKLDGGITRELLGMMFDSPVGTSARPTPLMQTILEECVASFAEEVFRICEMTHFPDVEQPPTFSALRIDMGSGAMLVELQGDCPSQMIAFGGEVVGRIVKDTGSSQSAPYNLASRESAIGNYKANLNVIAGHAELTLHDLVNLEVGDVIRLDALVRNPFAVRTSEGLSIAKAHLGIHGDYKAIQLIED